VTEARFRILVAAIKDDKSTVLNLMEKAAKGGEVTIDDYRTWPAFGALREDLTFRDQIRKVFGKELIVGSSLPSPTVESNQFANP
jgi:hypothetical protein